MDRTRVYQSLVKLQVSGKPLFFLECVMLMVHTESEFMFVLGLFGKIYCIYIYIYIYFFLVD